MYANLSNSYQWNIMNHNNIVTDRIADILKNGKQVTPEQISMGLNTIRNRIKSPIMTQLLNSLNSGRITMVYADQIKIPIYLPFIILQPSKGTYAGVVFLNHCECSPTDDKYVEYNVDARKLKVSLESCYLALRMIELDIGHNTKLTAPAIIRPATKIYAHTITECINRKYSIKLDQTVFNQVIFMVSRYFIGTVLGYNPDSATMENYCMYNCMNPDLASIRIVNDQFDVEDFRDISTFITKLVSIPELKSRIGRLNVSSFVQMYVNLYNAPMTLALEVFSYLVYNIIAVNNTTYVNNYHMLKNIIGEEGTKLYAQLITILSE